MVRRRSTVRFRKGAQHRAWTCELTLLAVFHGPVAAAITKEEKAGPAVVARALACCNVGAVLAAIGTASAEQISGCRPDKFGHGTREDRHACAAAWRQCRLREVMVTSGIRCKSAGAIPLHV